MSRPRFLADNDLMDQIVLSVQRREPVLPITRLREVGLGSTSSWPPVDKKLSTVTHEQCHADRVRRLTTSFSASGSCGNWNSNCSSCSRFGIT